MRDIQVATAQFEHQDAGKDENLQRIDQLALEAARQGAELVCFHECSITGYTFLQHLQHTQICELAEAVPDGPSTKRLIEIARRHKLAVAAGLIERNGQQLFNTYIFVSPDGMIAKHRKLHPFVSPYLSAGGGYTVFDYAGVKFGILICYDNNLPENVRATTLLGAEVILMPHVTGCLPSPMPGRGTVSHELWEQRHRDPVRLRMEFQGPKGRQWLMRWLPARAWENGIYAVFSNPIGVDGNTIKPGLSMVLDPHGEVLAECHRLDDDVVVACLIEPTYREASGRRYLAARRPELYGPLTRPLAPGTRSVTRPGWQLALPPDVPISDSFSSKREE